MIPDPPETKMNIAISHRNFQMGDFVYINITTKDINLKMTPRHCYARSNTNGGVTYDLIVERCVFFLGILCFNGSGENYSRRTQHRHITFWIVVDYVSLKATSKLNPIWTRRGEGGGERSFLSAAEIFLIK